MNEVLVGSKPCVLLGGVDIEVGFNSYKFLISCDAMNFIEAKEIDDLCRIILVPIVSQRANYIAEYLFWFIKKDLRDLDVRLGTGNYSQVDFQYAVNTSFVPGIECRNCHTIHKGGLVIDNSMLMYLFHDWKTKVEQLHKLNVLKRCPVCGGSLGVKVVKLFQ